MASCGYCGQTSNFMPRPGAPTSPAAGRSINDPARIERLRAQASEVDQPPGELVPLLQTKMTGQPLAEVERLIAQHRGRPPSAERDTYLYWLTVALYNTYTGSEHAVRQRALIETAIELIADPRRRASLVGMLARNAARSGESEAAWNWVQRMDPASESLTVDSAYRLTRAYVSTSRGDFGDVLAVLGEGIGDIPADGSDTLMCGVLRANALERRGNVPVGAAQLRAFMEHDPNLAGLIDQIVAANPTLHLCTQALVLASS